MRFAGLFIGVDRQFDTDIEALTYAGRDAQACWAAFADANEAQAEGAESDTELLVGDDATKGKVVEALGSLAARTHDHHYDLVVVHICCHGTTEGQLILADTITADLERTALPIHEVAAALEQMKAGAAVIIFESCFSGLAVGRASNGDDASLRTIMGTLNQPNRAVVWAAGPGERAWETPRLQHGVLTYSLVVEGLYGTYVEENGQISLRRWLDFAIERAQTHAKLDGVIQHPGSIIWFFTASPLPRFSPGRRRERQLRGDRIYEVKPDLSGLETYGLDGKTIESVRKRIDGNHLTDLQRRAIYPEGALAGQSLLISGPTSCGKTLVGELAALAMAARRLKTAVLLPMRALAAEKWREFDEAFGSESLRAVRSYGGTNDDDHLVAKGHFDVGFFTFEKFWLLALTNPRLLDSLGLVVIDEVHMLADANRGHTVELILTLLRRRRAIGKPIQLIALSAALGDLRNFPAWLNAQLVPEERRPLPLFDGVIGPSGIHRRRNSNDNSESNERVLPVPITVAVRGRDATGAKARSQVAAALIRTLVTRGEQILVFRSAKWSVRSLAQDLTNMLRLPACTPALDSLRAEDTGSDHSRASEELHQCLQAGVGFHISDLDRAEREVIEAAFRSGHLRVLVATSGLAMGVNLPATTVIIADHAYATKSFAVSEYLNMAGRAGRWVKGVSYGTSYLLAEREPMVSQLFDTFVRGTAEPLESQLGKLAYEDLALVLLAMSPTPLTAYELLIVACDTFAGFQHQEDSEWRRSLDRGLSIAIDKLEVLGFITREDSRICATPYGLVCGREGLRVVSAQRVLQMATAIIEKEEPLNEIALIGLTQVTDELDELETPVERNGDFQVEYNAWRTDSQLTLGSQSTLLELLETTAANDARYIQRLKRLNTISMWVRGMPLSDIENTFSRCTPNWKTIEPASGAVRQAAERTADMIRAVARLIAVKYPQRSVILGDMATALVPRLEHGVGREATALMRLGLGIRRGAAVQLIAAGVNTPAALQTAVESDDPCLPPIFGSEGVYRMRAMLNGRHLRGGPDTVARSKAASQRSLFDQIGDATAI